MASGGRGFSPRGRLPGGYADGPDCTQMNLKIVVKVASQANGGDGVIFLFR
jgi:hypothetical protein